MVVQGNGELRQDVLTLRISHLSRSAEFRQHIVERMNNGDDPFNLGDVSIGGVGIDIVEDEKDEFAGKLDTILGTGAGQAYLQEAEDLGSYLTDTQQHRQHLWDWWKDAAASNATLAGQIRAVLTSTLDQGTDASFTGDYSGSSEVPEAVVSPDALGNLRGLFRTDEVPGIEKP